jgi:4-amino-4-deoxy-L-arabinose transferase-like glycosyltransferase
MASDTARHTGRREIVVLQVLVLVFLALRLSFDLRADLFGDEAYYWMWGQRLGWSYFDHPPLHAWLLRLVSIVAGWHPFSVRLLSWLTLGGVLLLFRNWSTRLAPDAPRLWFWRTAAIYLSSPIFFGMTMIAYNDHLLVFLCLLAIHCFVTFVDRSESGAARPLRWLYAAAIALGLATLTKYNGALIGFGFAATFLLRPKLRRLLATPHPWLAGLVAILMQAPVVYWNLTASLASFRYHLDDRWGSQVGHFSWLHPVNFILLCIILWSPFLIWPLVRMLRGAPASEFEGRARTVVVSTFAISTLVFLAISCVLDAYFYWNIVAFIGLMPLLTRFLGNPILRWAHFIFGLLLAVLIVVNFSVIPVGELVGIRDRGSSSDYNWTAIGEHMRAAQEKTPADLIAATRYSTTAQLGFVLGTPDTVKLSPEHSQYDYWQNEAGYAGKSALILTDEPDGAPRIVWLQQHFATLTQVDSFDTVLLGRTLYTWRIFRGEGFHQ